MVKPTICIGKSKGADQLRSNCEADQCLCFRYTDSTIPLLSISKISSLLPSSVTSVAVQHGLCRTWSEPELLVFSRTSSNMMESEIHDTLLTMMTSFTSRTCSVPSTWVLSYSPAVTVKFPYLKINTRYFSCILCFNYFFDIQLMTAKCCGFRGQREDKFIRYLLTTM